jgi:hypothetical protein
VISDNIKHTFDAQMDMEWLTFQDKVHNHFEKPRGDVELVYRIGDKGPMSELEGEGHWDKAMCQLRQRI